jgi:hypothetical protein
MFLVHLCINVRYVKFVNKQFAKIETILKVILTAKDPPAGLVQNYFLLIADKSVTNFLKVLELKVQIPLDRTLISGYSQTGTKPIPGTLQFDHGNSDRSH